MGHLQHPCYTVYIHNMSYHVHFLPLHTSIHSCMFPEYPNISVTTEPAREGGKTKLTCTSTSAHATEFMWYHNGSQIFNASEKYLFSGKILTIRDISRADLGQYTCTVRDIIHVPRSGAADLTFTGRQYWMNCTG